MRIVTCGLAISLTALGLTGNALAAPVETVLYSFKGGGDGSIPYASLLADKQGVLYGATDIGGGTSVCEGNTGGCGTVFKLTPPATGQTVWTKTVLHSFTGSDGANPQQGLIADDLGALYGTTFEGGGASLGTVFKLMPPARGETQWTETVPHSFAAGVGDGIFPSGVIADKQGALYGTTEFGGCFGRSCLAGSFGTVFKVTPPAKDQSRWTETVLYRFKGGSDGAFPLGSLMLDEQGALYGTTYGGSGCNGLGCGMVFKLTPPAKGQTVWTKTVLYSFKGGSDGSFPNAGLIADKEGALYGPTTQGGIDACKPETGCGTVFKLTPPAKRQTAWTETVLYTFMGGSDGGFPNAGLIADKEGALYGPTEIGGSAGGIGGSSGNGTVFKLTPPAKGQTAWTETVLYSFKGGSDGAFPSALIANSRGALFGAASRGGNIGCSDFGCGTVFELNSDSLSFEIAGFKR